MQQMNGYNELKDALIAFRQVFKQKILSPQVISAELTFFRKVVDSDVATWSTADAFKLYHLLKGYSAQLKLVGCDFSKVPPPMIAKKYTANSTDKIIGYNGNTFKIRTPYITQIINEIRKIPGRHYDTELKTWNIPISESKYVQKLATDHKFKVGDKAAKMLRNISGNLEQSYSAERIDLNLPVKMNFYDYQTVGVDYTMKNFKVIIGDQMGLGKTCQGIGGVVGTNSFPTITICPKSLRENWLEEWTQWTDKKMMILTHKNVKSLKIMLEKGMIDGVIMNYEGVKTFFVEEIRKIEITKGKRAGKFNKKVYTNGLERLFKSVILDEAHNCRNMSRDRFRTVKKVFDDKDVRICLTGTPIVKGPNDMAALLTLIGRINEFGSAYHFNKAFKHIDKNFKNIANNTQLSRLNVQLRSTCFIRREKHQVLKDLPDKFRKIIRVELSNRKEYDHIYISLQSWLSEQNYTPEQIQKALRAELLVKIGLMKKCAAEGKFDVVKEFAQEVLEGGEKLIIFCWFNDTVAKLVEAFPGAVQISGQKDGREMKSHEVQEAKNKFQNDPDAKIMVITYKKGGEGHTLTAASKVAFIELGWTYKDQAQAEDRAHRIGQKNTVECYYFLGKDTIDEDIYKIIDQRRMIEKETTGGSEKIETTFSQISNKLIKELI